MPTPAFDTAQAEGSPAVEPSPIPDKVFAANSQSDTSKSEGLALGSTVNAPGAGLDIAGTGTNLRRLPSLHRMSRHREQARSLSNRRRHRLQVAAIPRLRRRPLSHLRHRLLPRNKMIKPAVAQTSDSASPAVGVMRAKAAPQAFWREAECGLSADYS